MDVLDHSFAVAAVNDTIDRAAGTRSLTLAITHPGIIWTGGQHFSLCVVYLALTEGRFVAIAFDAHVLKWNLDDNPPDEVARHHIKEASFYGHDLWTVDLVIDLSPSSSDTDADGKLRVDFVGVHEKAMWPGKKAEKAEGGRAMQLFEEFDAWLDEKMAGTVDATLLGCVGGVAWV